MLAVPVITSGGTELPGTWDVVSVEVVNEANRIPYAQVVLADGEIAKAKFPALESDFASPGTEIEIKVRQGDDISPLFKGLVARVRLEFSGGGPRVALECKDKALKLAAQRHSVIYSEEKNDSDAISAVLRRSSINAGDLGSGETVAPLVQYDSTDWDFIVSRAEAMGSVVVVKDGELSLKALSDPGSAVRTFQLGIDQIEDFELELDATGQPTELSSAGWDIKQGQLTDASAARSTGAALGNVDPADAADKLGLGETVLRHLVPMESSEIQSWANGRLARSRLAMFRGRLTTGGTGDIIVMDLVELRGFSPRFNGNALVSGIRHSLENGDWRTDLRLGLSGEPFAGCPSLSSPPAGALLPPARALTVAIVADYKDDPASEFRVPVAIGGVGGGEGIVWARLASPEAGSERGYFFRPDPGDEVVLGFLADDPRQPVILGALFSSKNKPPPAFAKFDDKNLPKGLVTKHGIALELKDEDKKPVLTLKTPKSKIAIDDDKGEIRLEDGNSNSIVLDKSGIKLTSGKDFTIEAKGKVVIKGKSIDAN